MKINDFFLIHGVTSAWSLSRIIPHLEAADATEALFYYLNALLIAYVCQNCPDMDLNRLENDDETKKLDWPRICQMVLEMPMDTTDEHVFKLIQVCKDQKDKSQSDNMDAICKRAAITSMSKPFF